MLEVMDKLEKQNAAIFDVMTKRNAVSTELEECKGIFKKGKRKKLQEEYDTLTPKIDNMKGRLKKICAGIWL